MTSLQITIIFIVSLIWVYIASRLWHTGKMVSYLKIIPALASLIDGLSKAIQKEVSKFKSNLEEKPNGKK